MSNQEKILKGLFAIISIVLILFVASSYMCDIISSVRTKLQMQKIERKYKKQQDSIKNEQKIMYDSLYKTIQLKDKIIQDFTKTVATLKYQRDKAIKESRGKNDKEINDISNTDIPNTISVYKRLNEQ